MSRSQTRARRRRARLEQAQAEFIRARENPATFAGLLGLLAETDTPIWAIAEAASRASPLDDGERAMIAQAVAPRLAGMTPGSVTRRHAMGSASQVSNLQPEG